mmetsp:Transcript_17619/g.44363  ORF Transcript_17619/g.44363 Transcript_17619/m.44363 type:complete len:212 (-) Transcript_17619:237-872(-)
MAACWTCARGHQASCASSRSRVSRPRTSPSYPCSTPRPCWRGWPSRPTCSHTQRTRTPRGPGRGRTLSSRRSSGACRQGLTALCASLWPGGRRTLLHGCTPPASRAASTWATCPRWGWLTCCQARSSPAQPAVLQAAGAAQKTAVHQPAGGPRARRRPRQLQQLCQGSGLSEGGKSATLGTAVRLATSHCCSEQVALTNGIEVSCAWVGIH